MNRSPHNNRIMVFAMQGDFSFECIKSMVLHNINIVGIIFPDHSAITGKQFPVTVNKPIMDFCDQHNISYCLTTTPLQDGAVDFLREKKPDIIITACFPQKIPEEILQLPVSGAYNLHPSLLPEYKGPVPLFWQFYYGEENTGISLQRMTGELDAGPVILSKQVAFANGITGIEANNLLARHCGTMIRQLIDQINTGDLQYQEQKHEGSYYTWPSISEFTVTPDWSVKRVFNFIRGTAHWNQPYTISFDSEKIAVREVYDYKEGAKQSSPIIKNNGKLSLRFKDGILIAGE